MAGGAGRKIPRHGFFFVTLAGPSNLAGIALLCAGLGTRLRPLTEFCAKPAVILAGRPMVFHILDEISGLDPLPPLALNSHHAPETLQAAVANYRLPKDHKQGGQSLASIKICHEPELLGSGGGLFHLSSQLPPGWLMVLNGDALLQVNWADIFDQAKALKEDQAAWLVTPPQKGRLSGLQLDGYGFIRDLVPAGEKCLPAFSGLALVGPELRKKFPHISPCGVMESFYRPLMKSRKLKAFTGVARFMDLGTRLDLMKAEELILAAG